MHECSWLRDVDYWFRWLSVLLIISFIDGLVFKYNVGILGKLNKPKEAFNCGATDIKDVDDENG